MIYNSQKILIPFSPIPPCFQILISLQIKSFKIPLISPKINPKKKKKKKKKILNKFSFLPQLFYLIIKYLPFLKNLHKEVKLIFNNLN